MLAFSISFDHQLSIAFDLKFRAKYLKKKKTKRCKVGKQCLSSCTDINNVEVKHIFCYFIGSLCKVVNFVKDGSHNCTQTKSRVEVTLVRVISAYFAYGSPLMGGSATLVPLTAI